MLYHFIKNDDFRLFFFVALYEDKEKGAELFNLTTIKKS
jgi:hypothetical protein